MGTTPAGLTAFTQNLENILKDKKITKIELCERTAIAPSSLYRKLNDPEVFSLKQAGNIAAAVGVPLADLFKEPAK